MGKWRDTGNMTARQMLDIPPIWLIGALGLVWLQVTLWPGLSRSFGITRLLGGGLIVVGVGLLFWAVAAFRAHQTSVVPHQVPVRIITTGPFAISRNPIYLGDVMILVGAVLWMGAWPSMLLIPCFIWLLTRRFIAPEEARMKESFRKEFAIFAEKTPRWL